jgi:general secretion pathway protein M
MMATLLRWPALAQRLLALALVAGALASIYAGLIRPVMAHFVAAGEAIQQERTVLGRLKEISSQRDTAQDLDRRNKELAASGLLIEGETEAIRAAALQALVAEAASARSVRVRSTRALPPKERDGLAMMGVRLQASATPAELQALLYDLESRRPVLFVDSVAISGTPGINAQLPDEAARLEVRFDLYGVVRRSKGAAQP